MSKVVGMDGKIPNAQVNIKPEDLKDIVCENCGGKYLSALISSSGKEQIVPLPTFRCDDCGHINEEFLVK